MSLTASSVQHVLHSCRSFIDVGPASMQVLYPSRSYKSETDYDKQASSPKHVQIEGRYCIHAGTASMQIFYLCSMSCNRAGPTSTQILHPCRFCMNESDTNIQASSFKSVQIDRRYCIQAYLASIA